MPLTFAQAKTKAIQLIDEYSTTNGNLISSNLNAEYNLKFPGLADDAQAEISDTVGIDASYTLDLATAVPIANSNGYNKYSLPPDFKQHWYLEWNDQKFFDYRLENNQLIIPECYNSGTIIWSYYKYPQQIIGMDSTAQDAYTFEVDAYMHPLIPYYMGGMAAASEATGLSSTLLNIYYTRLKNSHKRAVRYPNRVVEKVRW